VPNTGGKDVAKKGFLSLNEIERVGSTLTLDTNSYAIDEIEPEERAQLR